MTTLSPTRHAKLAQQIATYLPTDGIKSTSIPGLILMRASQTGDPRPIVYTPCVYVIAQGAKSAYLGDDVFTYDALHYLVLTVPLPLQAHIIEASEAKPYLAMRLDINLVQLNQILIDMGDTNAPSNENSSRGIFISTINDEFADSASRLIATLSSAQRAKVLGHSIIKEMFYHVLCGEQGHLLRSFAQSNRHDHQIANVIHFIQKNYFEPIDVADLANVANMSQSSLHHHFKTVTRSSPVQYIKTIRLHRAKRMIIDESQSISETAFKVGYASPSQFSREYKRLFGIAPSQELNSAVLDNNP
jgi:AraC-like DNA-binding protein